jgi:hypothetical protein
MPNPIEKVTWYSLTTLARVKSRLDIQINDKDDVLTRIINSTTDFIERECGKTGLEKYPNDGHFVQKTYTNEVYSVRGTRQQFLILRNAPVTALTSFQWRAGTPSNPNWTDFIPDQFELVEEGGSGIVRVYGVMPRLYSNMLRATYTAGYPVDWQNAGNYSGTTMTHLLPEDLTNTCENIVERIFRRRGLAGKASENIQGSTISWKDQLDALDRNTLTNYKRPLF